MSTVPAINMWNLKLLGIGNPPTNCKMTIEIRGVTN